MSEELKPCPFCGSEVVFRRTEMFAGERSPSVIKCRNCNYRVASLGPGSDDTVVTIWNTRPIEDALVSQLREAEAERDSEQRWANEYHASWQKAEAEMAALRDEMTNALEMLNRAHVGPGDVAQKRLNAENHVRGWLMRRLQMADIYYPARDAGKEEG